MTNEIAQKLTKVRACFERWGVDGFLFSSQANVFYLSHFRSTNAYVLMTGDNVCFLTDSRYIEKAKKELASWEVVEIKGDTIGFLKKFIQKAGVKRLGFEKDKVSCAFKEKLRSNKFKLVGVVDPLGLIRMIKSKEEIEVLKEGVKKTDKVFNKVLQEIERSFAEGYPISELKIRGFLVSQMFIVGGRGESFPAIVAFGKNSSVPHWETSEALIERNGVLLLDFGMVWKGYATDFTRTIYLGDPPAEFVKLYNILKDAWFLGFEKVKVGEKVAEIDRAIRDYLVQKDLAKYFIHATGHGIGVEVHEAPRVIYTVDPDLRIEEGMVFTIEPGLYFPDNFGIRLENMVFVEGGRGEIVSEVSLDLITL
ncbi:MULTISPECIES: Xaa-Pro peptidase family protein [Thermodesulfobacterium]|jgi:Xaa-Pro aminopeptidase/Xaa-Pro dipeptidase|uniref:Xaa-Pro dipeptidase n=2 Tax=Thermodesulfobacterium commune TaxID=1741 RepID=A0A075WVJ7_9BACT|nr:MULTISPECIES: Xaa-Pro peptidase family protein [Thermodesulfobacterium]KUK37300.1 MAG: Peptidase M24 [Thermodesulfobacterium commune]AIH04493.1 Xaa-Pro dipeptidase [Thermodesulfobacterium commune DSM 2178]MBZ4681590.1 Xaa-Pro dipeptidase [Thermodesulfobacterium sp.]MDK2862167.1 Xaa-Pro aminopeptidase [Thermodesulfobacterium sp.]HAA84634.1 aminopeptidase P family protein [Thermodesulfobacterium commune]